MLAMEYNEDYDWVVLVDIHFILTSQSDDACLLTSSAYYSKLTPSIFPSELFLPPHTFLQ